MNYFVYILYSEGFQKYYVGQTNDLQDRMSRHNNGHNESTKPYKPWKLLFAIEKNSRSEAVILEKKLKNLSKIKLIEFIKKHSNNHIAGADQSVSVPCLPAGRDPSLRNNKKQPNGCFFA